MPGFRPPPPQPTLGLPDPRPQQPHLRRLETRAVGGAEKGGGPAEPDSPAGYLRLSGAKPRRERKAGPGGGEGRSGGFCAGAFRERVRTEETEKQPGQEAAGARGGVAHFPTERWLGVWRGFCSPPGSLQAYLSWLC